MAEGIRTLIASPDAFDGRMALVRKDAAALIEFGPVEVTVAQHVPKRTVDQNDLMWSICTDIAVYLNAKTKPEVPFDKEDIHDRLLIERYGHDQVQVGSVAVTRVPRTRKFGKTKMSEFISWMIAWALDRRIPIEIPASPEFAAYREAQA